ncbi:F-box domain containing protein [Pandoravirus salinus]|uniref:F-box domain containing protein n=1 Tax=Pandoravirus salinus TaxID=1349410 RepID=S4VT17_9VIRU|nr:F-box domain [Pandoravirus salinus]AGO83438.1 F-box domain containing protein [Pandoravirus salinus]
MGASPSAPHESKRCAVRIWVALHDAAATTNPRSRLRAAGPGAVGLADMPPEVLSLVFAYMVPLDAAVAMARCARTCRALAAFARQEMPRTFTRSFFADATPSLRPKWLMGLHGQLGRSPAHIDPRLVHVLLPVLHGVCAVPVTLVSPRAGGFDGAKELAAAIGSWYLARATRDDLAFARDAAHGLYRRRCDRATLLRDALIPMGRRGVGPARIRTGDVRPLDTMGRMPALFASLDRRPRHWYMLFANIVLCEDVVAVCMCARISAWPCRRGVPVPPPCRSSGARCLTTHVIISAFASN